VCNSIAPIDNTRSWRYYGNGLEKKKKKKKKKKINKKKIIISWKYDDKRKIQYGGKEIIVIP
jgi:hypothetical protein